MHHCCLLTPTARELWGNLGHAMIEAGIRYLIRSSQPDVVFHRVDMIRRDPEIWAWVQAHADSLVICGVPRLGPMLDLYRGKGFWADVLTVRRAGVPVADLFPGVHYPLAAHRSAYTEQILANPENRYVLACERELNLVLPRDRLFAAAAAELGDNYRVMPCGSYWAFRWYDVEPESRTLTAIALRADMGVPDWTESEIARHQGALARERETVVLLQNAADAEAAARAGIHGTVFLTEPADYLRLLARVETLISLRVHATIPALGLGCRVLNIGIDSRAEALTEYGVASHPIDILRDDTLPINLAQYPVMLDYRHHFLSLWKEHMHR